MNSWILVAAAWVWVSVPVSLGVGTVLAGTARRQQVQRDRMRGELVTAQPDLTAL